MPCRPYVTSFATLPVFPIEVAPLQSGFAKLAIPPTALPSRDRGIDSPIRSEGRISRATTRGILNGLPTPYSTGRSNWTQSAGPSGGWWPAQRRPFRDSAPRTSIQSMDLGGLRSLKTLTSCGLTSGRKRWGCVRLVGHFGGCVRCVM